MYQDRKEAGEKLAKILESYKNNANVVVLGLPRGGVVVAAEVARHLNASLDVIVVKKIGAPGNPEFAIGAVASGGIVVCDRADEDEHLAAEIEKVKEEVARREKLFRKGKPRIDLSGKTAIIVDDGIATGATVQAAVEYARHLGAARVVVASPVAATDSAAKLSRIADEFVCPQIEGMFFAVGQFYESFDQVEDREVLSLLHI